MNWIAGVFVVCSAVCHLCQAYEFHFVTEKKNWTEAQKYCRANHIDLATVRDSYDMDTLNETVNQASDVWIGLRRGWRWSLGNASFYREGEKEFRNWSAGEPNNPGTENCTEIGANGLWNDASCRDEHPFICYSGNNDSFILIDESKTWASAQRYCRENHTDLASVRSQTENVEVVKALGEIGASAWIGLYWDWEWSDQSDVSFTDWAGRQPDNKNREQECAQAFWKDRGKVNGTWDDRQCDTLNSFACYDDKMTLVEKNLTWADALAYCRSRHGDLVSVDSEEVQRLVAQVAGRASSPAVWLGLRFSCTLGFWFWVEGKPVCYHRWAPNNGTGEGDCGSTGVLDKQDLRWVSKPQMEKFNFICTKTDGC